MKTPATARPITLLVCALGGEGGGVLAEWLVETAIQAGHAAQSTSIPGVAQRTGATTYYVEISPIREAELGSRKPVFSLNPVPGGLDLMISSELLETARQLGNGMASPDRTIVISSSHRTLTTAEKMQLADGRRPDADLLGVVHRMSRVADVFDMAEMAQRAGTVTSAVMFGAIAGTGLLPFPRSTYEDVIKASGKGVAASLAGFGAAYDRMQGIEQAHRAVHSAVRAARESIDSAVDSIAGASPLHDVHAPVPSVEAALATDPPPAIAQRFPQALHELVTLGYARLVDYQDAAYAALYLDRLEAVLRAERSADPNAEHAYATTLEAARWLALWMAFDDIVRVAALKCRASRLERVRREVRAAPDELLRVYDHFKPGIPEFASILPKRLADAATAWDRRRAESGKEPFAWPMKIGAHSVFGFLALRTLAATKGLRRYGARYAVEQALIERWLARVVEGSSAHWQLGHEIAACGRLIKGYGSTNERGKENLLHVLDHLAVDGRGAGGTTFATPLERAEAIAAARRAALADEGGKALDRTLEQYGAPKRAPKPVPIRFVRKPRQSA